MRDARFRLILIKRLQLPVNSLSQICLNCKRKCLYTDIHTHITELICIQAYSKIRVSSHSNMSLNLFPYATLFVHNEMHKHKVYPNKNKFNIQSKFNNMIGIIIRLQI